MRRTPWATHSWYVSSSITGISMSKYDGWRGMAQDDGQSTQWKLKVDVTAVYHSKGTKYETAGSRRKPAPSYVCPRSISDPSEGTAFSRSYREFSLRVGETTGWRA